MRYGKIINGGMLMRGTPADGYKPVVETAPEVREGYYNTFRYEDTGEDIAQVWEYHEIDADAKEEVERRGISDAEALDILLGGGGE